LKSSSVILPLTVLLFSFIVSCHPGRHEEMQRQLETLSLHNQQDSVLTDDSLAQALADWFDDHGKPNEQVLAHYLLGRTHADRGEAPAAIAAYHDAIDRADTTAQDCDYGLVYRVFSQMASVFYRQNLLEDQLYYLEKARQYAILANDSIVAMSIRAYEMTGYDKLEMPDSVLQICKEVNVYFSSINHPEIAAQNLGLAIKAFADKKEYDKMKACMDIYESRSGYFDSKYNIERGREAYYYLKGCYLLSVHNYDSAYYYFRKELLEGDDLNNQYLGSKGLAKLYLQKHNADSAAKYAQYSSDINDSISSHTATVAVANAQGLYNYSRSQQLLSHEREKTEKMKRQIISLSLSLVVIITIVGISIRIFLVKKRREREAVEEMKAEYLVVRDEVLWLRAQKSTMEEIVAERNKIIDEKVEEKEEIEIRNGQLENQLKEKETLLEQLLMKVEEYIKTEKMKQEGAEERIAKSSVIALLHEKANKGKKLNDSEWNDINRLIIDQLPELNHFLMQKMYALNDMQYRICILLRLHIPQASIGAMLGVSPPYIQKMCKKSLSTLFGINGTGSDLHNKLNEIN